jgi:hypothetical protein
MKRTGHSLASALAARRIVSLIARPSTRVRKNVITFTESAIDGLERHTIQEKKPCLRKTQ